MRVKDAKKEDVEGIVTFLKKAWMEASPAAMGWTGASEKTISEITTPEFLSSLLERKDVHVHLLVYREEIVGFASLRKINDKRVELSGIIIPESMTGKGFGTKLLEASINKAKGKGFSIMSVKTEKLNERAIGFYKSKGFRECRTLEQEIEGYRVTLLELNLDLRPHYFVSKRC